MLNLLYSVSPGWGIDYGGNLELWPDGMKGVQITIQRKFNRLAVMATHDTSWHSVSPVVHDAARSNKYGIFFYRLMGCYEWVSEKNFLKG